MALRRGLIGFFVLVSIAILLFTVIQSRWNAVTLSLEVATEGTVLTVSGETNLPERTLLIYEVAPKSAAAREREGLYATGVVVVNRGVYRVELDTSLFETYDVIVTVRFQVSPDGPPQSAAVVKRFGRNGERINGKNLVRIDQRNHIQVSEFILLEEP